MEAIIDELFTGSKSLGILIFSGLLFYFVLDIIKKSNRIDDLLKQLTSISKDLHDVRNTMQLERATGEYIRRDVEELKKLMGSFSHRVVRIETKLQAAALQEDGLDEH